MTESALALDTLGWLRLLVGLPLWLAPGLAAADRWLPKERGRFILAPVASISLLTLTAFAQEFLLGLKHEPWLTALNAAVLAAWIGWPRIRQAPEAARSIARNGIRWRPPRGVVWGLPLVLGFVMLVHSLPHLPGPGADGALDAYPTLLDRATDDHYPYPIHVDEHIHAAFAGKMIRDRVIDINNPYTDAEPAKEIFSVSGFRAERGFTLGIVEMHDLLGVPLGVLFRFLPAIWSGYLALTVWYALRPAPGAIASAAFVAILPTTSRFLGVGFLISSPFALPWIFAALAVTVRGQGPARFFAIMLLVTGAYFQHLVLGTLTIGTALAAMLLNPRLRVSDRVGITAATLLPMLWILPGIWAQVQEAVGGEHSLPFEAAIFAHPGAVVYLLAVLGSAIAFWGMRASTTPHRALAVMAVLMAFSMWWSLENDHRNDATYSRLLFAFFLSIGSLAGLAIGQAARWSTRAWRRPQVAAAALAAVLVAMSLPTAIAGNLETPYYRVHNDASWASVEAFEGSGAGPGDVFLMHPWQAPLANAVTGAEPHTYLMPGNPPIRGEDWTFYVRSNGADADWLDERDIRYVVNGPRPNAPHTELGPRLYRIL